jgi:hypothetical protein
MHNTFANAGSTKNSNLQSVHARYGPQQARQRRQSRTGNDLNTESELYANIDVASHFDNLGELHGLFSGALKIVNGKNLQAGVIDL